MIPQHAPDAGILRARESGAKKENESLFLSVMKSPTPLPLFKSPFWQEDYLAGNVSASKGQTWYAGLMLAGSGPSGGPLTALDMVHLPQTGFSGGEDANFEACVQNQELVSIWILKTDLHQWGRVNVMCQVDAFHLPHCLPPSPPNDNVIPTNI